MAVFVRHVLAGADCVCLSPRSTQHPPGGRCELSDVGRSTYTELGTLAKNMLFLAVSWGLE